MKIRQQICVIPNEAASSSEMLVVFLFLDTELCPDDEGR
jgi:hypothetical protein